MQALPDANLVFRLPTLRDHPGFQNFMAEVRAHLNREQEVVLRDSQMRSELDGGAGDGGAFGKDPDTDRDLEGTSQTARDRNRIAFIEDNRLVREGIAALLERFPDFDVVEADSGARAH